MIPLCNYQDLTIVDATVFRHGLVAALLFPFIIRPCPFMLLT